MPTQALDVSVATVDPGPAEAQVASAMAALRPETPETTWIAYGPRPGYLGAWAQLRLGAQQQGRAFEIPQGLPDSSTLPYGQGIFSTCPPLSSAHP